MLPPSGPKLKLVSRVCAEIYTPSYLASMPLDSTVVECVCTNFFCSAAALEDFDRYLESLNEWCEEQETGVSSPPAVKTIVAVRDRATAKWTRAQVSWIVSERFVCGWGWCVKCMWMGHWETIKFTKSTTKYLSPFVPLCVCVNVTVRWMSSMLTLVGQGE